MATTVVQKAEAKAKKDGKKRIVKGTAKPKSGGGLPFGVIIGIVLAVGIAIVLLVVGIGSKFKRGGMGGYGHLPQYGSSGGSGGSGSSGGSGGFGGGYGRSPY